MELQDILKKERLKIISQARYKPRALILTMSTLVAFLYAISILLLLMYLFITALINWY